MIIGSDFKFNVGDKRFGLRDQHKISHPDQPYIVIGESTFEDWLKEYEYDSGTVVPKYKYKQLKAAYFYIISVD